MTFGPSEDRRARQLRKQFKQLEGGDAYADQAGVPRLSDAEKELENRRALELRSQFRVIGGAFDARLPAAPAGSLPSTRGAHSQHIHPTELVELDARVHFRLGVKCSIKGNAGADAYYEIQDFRTGETVKSWSLTSLTSRQTRNQKLDFDRFSVSASVKKGEISLSFREKAAPWALMQRLANTLKKPETIVLTYTLLDHNRMKANFEASDEWKSVG
ncbi:MAG: hypothetical protein KDD70_00140 [Bdellovibrionales bacterium]|nr:hypothetical protein [Bdellovibrionales bacterium]